MYDLLSGVLPFFDLRWNFVLRCTEVGFGGTNAAQCDETAGSCRNPLLIAMSGVAVAGMPEPIWNKETRMSDCGSQAYCHRHVAVCDLNRGCAVLKELEEATCQRD